VSVDLSEISHKPMPTRSPADHHSVTASLKASVEALQSGLAKLDASVACHRPGFERERDRNAQSAKEAVVRLEGELKALRPWWRRLAG
jgi:hypothetical protein